MTDVALVHLPASWRLPVPEWCLGHRYLAGSLREAGYDAEIRYPPFVLDGTAASRLVDDLLDRAPPLVAFTTYDAQLPNLYAFVGELRRRGLPSHITVGGLSATAAASDVLARCPGIDSVVVGEGERTIVDLADHAVRGGGGRGVGGRGPFGGAGGRDVGEWPVAGTVVRDADGCGLSRGEPRPFVGDLAALPRPVWDDLSRGENRRAVTMANHCAPVIGSRGCYGRCTFCCIERFYRSVPGTRPWRPSPASRVADDVTAVLAATGARQITFVDENFIGPGRTGRRHAVDVAAELRRRRLHVAFNIACRADDVEPETFRALQDAGLNAVTLGIESMSAGTLELFGKRISPQGNRAALQTLDDLGLQTEITFIFFHPLTTLDEIRDNVEFVAEVARRPQARFSGGQPFTSFIPLAGTALTTRLQRLDQVRGHPGHFAVRYADPRVALLERHLAAVPTGELLALQWSLPVGVSERVDELRARLGSRHATLTLARLPELLADACDAFDAGAREADDAVRRVIAAIDDETQAVGELLDRIMRHLTPQETGA